MLCNFLLTFAREALHKRGAGSGDAVCVPHDTYLVILAPAIVILTRGIAEWLSVLANLAPGAWWASNGTEADIGNPSAGSAALSAGGKVVVCAIAGSKDESLAALSGGVVEEASLLGPTCIRIWSAVTESCARERERETTT